MSNDKPLDDAVLEAAAQLMHFVHRAPNTAIARAWAISDPEEASRLVALAAAQPAIRERVATAQEEEIARLRGALEELIECADLRGDADLPAPSDDSKLWTARMQDAWNEARAALAQEG